MTGMWAQVVPSFIVPGLAAAGVAAVAVPVIIHILSRRPRRPEPWAAMKFLMAAYKRHRMRTRLEQWLLLATRCLLVLLLGLALAGPIFAAAGALGVIGGGQRHVVVVLDNSLTTQARGEADGQRFSALRDQAQSLLAGLQSNDRAALITTSRPAEAVISPATADPMSVLRQVELVEPSAAESNLREALRLAMRALGEAEAAPEQSYVVVLSDFSRGGADIDEPLPSEVRTLGQMATLLMNEPAETVTNQQIASLEPDRRLVVSEGEDQATSVSWTIGLRRYGDSEALAEGQSFVELHVPDRSPVRRPVSWEPGQTDAELTVDTPLDAGASGLLAVHAALDVGSGADGLTLDNERWALVRAREQLTVLVLGRRQINDAIIGPQQWLTIALAPVGDELGWPIDIRERDAATLGDDPSQLSEIDAVYVIRPDLLDDAAWTGLLRWVRGGGLAWFSPPAAPSASLWPQRVSDGLGLGWSVAAEPVAYEEDDPLRVDTAPAQAAELRRLRADLPDLLRPIEIYRRLAIDPASLGGGVDVLIEGSGGEPLLVGATTGTGRGRVLLSAMALDGEWTNLPVKPLFVPLIHEVLRAGIDRLQPEDSFAIGDQPMLGGRWLRAGRMTGPDETPTLLVEVTDGEAGEVIDPDEAEEAADEAAPGGVGELGEDRPAVRPISPLMQPGVYRGATDAIAVNVNPAAADTRAVERNALDAWLGELGAWRTLAVGEDGELALGGDADRADLSWPLLWAVAVLALLEMLLARWASHASKAGRSASVTDVRSPGRQAA